VSSCAAFAAHVVDFPDCPQQLSGIHGCSLRRPSDRQGVRDHTGAGGEGHRVEGAGEVEGQSAHDTPSGSMSAMRPNDDDTAPRPRRRFLRLRQFLVFGLSLLGAFECLDLLDPSQDWSFAPRLALGFAVYVVLLVALNWLLRTGLRFWPSA
jgi:hypothetical protein